MGNSSMEGKAWTKAFVASACPDANRILDIGPGQGTYWYILKDVVPNAEWIGIEVFKPYIDSFGLFNIYDSVLNMDIRNYEPDEDFDLVIAGDVLEHMTPDEALDVVDKLLPRCKYLVISLPIVHWPQGEVNGNPYEVHVKDDWSHTEMMNVFGSRITGFFNGTHIGVYVLDGSLLYNTL